MAEGEKFQNLRLQMAEEVLHGDREKAIREITDWPDIWQVISQGRDESARVLTCGFLPKTTQAAAWAAHSQGALHAAWPPLAKRQFKNTNPSDSWCYKTTHVFKPYLCKKLIPRLRTFCVREVRDLGGAPTSYITATSDLSPHPTGERAGNNSFHRCCEHTQNSLWKSYTQFKTTLAFYQHLYLPYKLSPLPLKYIKPKKNIQVKNYQDFDANSDSPMIICNNSRVWEQGETEKIETNTGYQIFCCLQI